MAFPLQLVMGLMGNAISLALYLCPMPTFRTIYKMKTTQEYSGLPYVFTLFNCTLGLLYGSPLVKPHSTLLLTINGAGFLLETFYLVSFLAFSSPKKRVMTTRLTSALMFGFCIEVAVIVFAVHTYHMRQLVVGTVGIVASIVMYAAPLSVLRLVIVTKSVQYMPFLLSLCNCLNAMVWLTYSIVTRDVFIAIPNCIGSVLGIIQLVVYCIFRKTGVEIIPEAKQQQQQEVGSHDADYSGTKVQMAEIPCAPTIIPKPNQVIADAV